MGADISTLSPLLMESFFLSLREITDMEETVSFLPCALVKVNQVTASDEPF